MGFTEGGASTTWRLVPLWRRRPRRRTAATLSATRIVREAIPAAALHFATMRGTFTGNVIMRSVMAVVLLMTFACGGGEYSAEGEGNPSPPNVLLITIDTLRADHLGVYGADLNTPIMDGLAVRGVRFTQARTHIPITGPSHSSIFTALLPMEHGVLNNGHELDPRFPRLAESMRSSGRQTAAVISLGVMQAKWGYDQGFDSYSGRFGRDWMKDAAEATDEILSVTEDFGDQPFFLWAHYSDPHEPYAPPGLDYHDVELRLEGNPLGTINSQGRGNRFEIELAPGVSELDFVPLEDVSGRGFKFTKLLVKDPAVEVQVPDDWTSSEGRKSAKPTETGLPTTVRLVNTSTESLTAVFVITCKEVLSEDEIRMRYALEVEFADQELGRLLKSLESQGHMDNTLVVLTSDHGEGLGDHGLVGHVSQLYDSLLHVPLVVSWPGELPQGLVVDDAVGLVDLFPTVAELVGAESPQRTSGTSLVPLLRGESAPPRPFFAATFRPQSSLDMRGILTGGLKGIHAWSDTRDYEELYDVARDPRELEDLSAARLEDLDRLRGLLEERLAEVGENAPIQADLSKEDEANLRALGYIN